MKTYPTPPTLKEVNHAFWTVATTGKLNGEDRSLSCLVSGDEKYNPYGIGSFANRCLLRINMLFLSYVCSEEAAYRTCEILERAIVGVRDFFGITPGREHQA